MTVSRQLQNAAALLMLSATFAQPAYPQKILPEGVKDLATQIAASASKQNKQKIAVLPFRDLDGKTTILGTYISEELVTDLFAIGGLEIVERAMLDRLIGELKLGQTGIIDPETAKKVGRVAGVDAIVTGSITDLQSYVALNCRLIDTQTGHIFGAAQTRIVKDDDVRKIMGATLSASVGADSRASAPRAEAPAATQIMADTDTAKQQQQQSEDFLFELKGCSLSGTSVRCELSVTNQGEDVRLTLPSRDSHLFDADGDVYSARDATLGGANNPNSNVMAPNVITGIPVKIRLTFDGIPPGTQRATLLEVVGYRGRQRFKVAFRNVPLARR